MENTSTLPPEDDDESAGNLTPAPAPKAKRAPAKAKEAAVSELITTEQSKRQTIILEENDGIPPTGLFIGINGRSYVLRAGEEVAVPQEVLGVLNDAVEDIPRVDGNNNVVDYRKKMRFPYRVIR